MLPCGNLTCIERQHLEDRTRNSGVKDTEPHPNCLKPDLPLDVFSHPIFPLLFCPLVFGFLSIAVETILSNTPEMEIVINGMSFQKLSVEKR